MRKKVSEMCLFQIIVWDNTTERGLEPARAVGVPL